MPAQLLGDVSLNGYPGAASGALRFYQPGTLIPVIVYSNDAATSAITQPVALDANGRSAVPIYVTKMVRMIVYDANGAQLQDVERADGLRAETTSLVNTSWPGVASEDAAWTALAISLGGTNGNYKASGSGAVARSIQAKLSERPSVKDFGAIGNGIADDTAAFVSAITFAGALGGATIDVPAGTYLIYQTLTIASDGVSLKGSGSAATILKNASSSGDLISCTSSRLSIEDLTVTASTTSTGKGISLSGTTMANVTIAKVRVLNHRTGVDITASVQRSITTIRDSEITCDGNTNAVGINVSGIVFQTFISNVYLLSGASGLGKCISLAASPIFGIVNTTVISCTFAQGAAGFNDTGSDGTALINNYGLGQSVLTATYTLSSSTSNILDFGTRAGNIGGVSAGTDASNGAYSSFMSPTVSGRWQSDFGAFVFTSISSTSGYSPLNGTFNAHHLRGTSAGITVTVNAPTTTPLGKGGSMLSFLFENTSGGAVTWTMNAIFRTSAAIAPATGTAITVVFQWNATLVKWVEVYRSAAV